MSDERKLQMYEDMLCWVYDHTDDYARALRTIGFSAVEAYEELTEECGINPGEAYNMVYWAYHDSKLFEEFREVVG